MKKRILSALIALIPSATLLAGGLTTNTNQNAAYLRQMSQEAIIDITGLYMNPAGTAFLAPGYHFSLNIQSAKQDRDIETTQVQPAFSTARPTHPSFQVSSSRITGRSGASMPTSPSVVAAASASLTMV